MSFAYLVFASAWFKRYHPAAFCAALINAQPMGFYSTQSLVDDARRHGVQVRRPDINASGALATLEAPTVGHRRAQRPGAAAVTVGDRRPRGQVGSVRGAHHRQGTRRPHRERATRARRLPGHARSGPTRRRNRQAAVRREPGGAGHRGRLRLPPRTGERRWHVRPGRATYVESPRGAVGGRGSGAGTPRPPARHGHGSTGTGVARHGRGGTDGGRRVVNRAFPRQPSGPVRPGTPRPAWARCRSPHYPLWRTAVGCWSAASSPTGNGRLPRAGSRSSTWRTRPACSTWSVRPGCGNATGGWPDQPRRCWCEDDWSAPRASSALPPTISLRSPCPSALPPATSVNARASTEDAPARKREARSGGQTCERSWSTGA